MKKILILLSLFTCLTFSSCIINADPDDFSRVSNSPVIVNSETGYTYTVSARHYTTTRVDEVYMPGVTAASLVLTLAGVREGEVNILISNEGEELYSGVFTDNIVINNELIDMRERIEVAITLDDFTGAMTLALTAE